ncbi:Acetyltransferase (GNAT) domain-containing protein [Cohaesibacter gelatinilyticus]|uniref:Acetyltransferase (GNAT) domain-containing protein n=2 Tax=Cohaesibacter gelatinilyticus TaxID=372072 RepID=A0A285PD88_9HYPH|nr:Acetyltransferase (GNAT) domain-containing protein [Cohaesibacter gelatinilyticus]
MTANDGQMEFPMSTKIIFTQLSEVEPGDILAHMCDPKVAEHMPLLTSNWDMNAVSKFVATKEECWKRDGLGHWAILADEDYIGWGGFQREGDEWDFGLVLKPDAFGLGIRITRKAIDFALADERIPFVTFLLPPSRKNLGALERLGAQFVNKISYDGSVFLKYRLNTER